MNIDWSIYEPDEMEVAAERKQQEEEKAVRKRQQQKCNETRMLTRNAAEWESNANLPKIEGRSALQINFARRCRYLLMRHRGFVSLETSAGIWIGQFLEAEK